MEENVIIQLKPLTATMVHVHVFKNGLPGHPAAYHVELEQELELWSPSEKLILVDNVQNFQGMPMKSAVLNVPPILD